MIHPIEELKKIALENDLKLESEDFAKLLVQLDPLKDIREQFEYPKMKQLPFVDLNEVDGEADGLYFCGNSLGLMPKCVRQTINQLFDQWSDYGVYGHHYGEHPWATYDEELIESMCKIVGANSNEVAIMNQLTTNLHFLLLTFYRPVGKRFKILCEDHSFPSDHYAFESQIKLHGLDPKDALVLLKPREGEFTLRTEDIIEKIKEEGDSLALICFSGVQYYTGQCFEIPKITEAGHEVGAFVGWDLAHSVGNVLLYLHDWNIDFAVWTTYKYLNAGAGNTGCAFLHEKNFNLNLPHLYGWWAHAIETRMDMTNEIQFGEGIRKYRMSNPSAFHCAALRGCLSIYDKTNMIAVRKRSVLLVAYFEYLLIKINEEFNRQILKLITPAEVNERGSQLSVYFFGGNVEEIHTLFKKYGLVCDERKPNVLRLAANPLYNNYMDIYRAYKLLTKVLKEI